ncbi:unnamed protein product [Didymodactylos carnosus]|uniref:Uncharacterized protein n=1 Tax=Didymodactylos carnosus TaxID=1234261 RepID=A0A814Q2C6_9BILA|nr:unnamed protein product [Didymodactylos carnosus]CAF1113686.1 unnamed protein product [Didymodactylos carnosus]CAF3768373.1 unnamed protein product [Didymodactylos carnosus]CAF3877830.1 unnamed protein product [Didymodactylos carnosus]
MILTVYRGQQLRRSELNKLIPNTDHLIFNNSFLSTTFNRVLALLFAGSVSSSNSALSVSILFEIEIDTSHTTRPYAYINGSGDEAELIITPGFVFRLLSVDKDNNTTMSNELWLIKLKSADHTEFLSETSTLLIGAGQPVVISFLPLFVVVKTKSPDETLEQG